MSKFTIIIHTAKNTYTLGYHNLDGCRKPKYEINIGSMIIKILWGSV